MYLIHPLRIWSNRRRYELHTHQRLRQIVNQLTLYGDAHRRAVRKRKAAFPVPVIAPEKKPVVVKTHTHKHLLPLVVKTQRGERPVGER